MLQNLANFLLGSTTTNTTIGEHLVEGVENNQSTSRNNTRVSLITTDHDDGWTLVDRDSEGNSETSSLCSEDEEEIGDLGGVPVTRTSSVDSLRGAGGMEESWFVTPPPSFTSSGPIHMETSPLENLLIEHPSMSVYQHTGGRRLPFQYPRSTSPSEVAVEEEQSLEEDEEEIQGGDTIVVVRRLPPTTTRCNRVQALQLHDTQLAKSRRAQKVQIKKSAQQVARGYLNRTNKAREANGRSGWHPRRKERCQGATRSHANNNRKC